MAIDVADRAILRLLQEDAGAGISELAEASGLSVASVQRRLKRLRSEKVIERDTAIINPTAVGQLMTFVVLVELERERLEQLHHFQAMVKAEPHVQQCYYVTGEADFILVCIAPDMQAFEALAQRLLFANHNVRRFRTSVVMGRVKVGMAVPV